MAPEEWPFGGRDLSHFLMEFDPLVVPDREAFSRPSVDLAQRAAIHVFKARHDATGPTTSRFGARRLAGTRPCRDFAVTASPGSASVMVNASPGARTVAGFFQSGGRPAVHEIVGPLRPDQRQRLPNASARSA